MDSLVAHTVDISTDTLINRSEYFAVSETWMENSMPVNVPGTGTNKTQIITTPGHRIIIKSQSCGIAIYCYINRLTERNRVNNDVKLVVGNSFENERRKSW